MSNNIVGRADGPRVSVQLIEGLEKNGKITYTHRIAVLRRASDTPTLPLVLSYLRLFREEADAWAVFHTMCTNMGLEPVT